MPGGLEPGFGDPVEQPFLVDRAGALGAPAARRAVGLERDLRRPVGDRGARALVQQVGGREQPAFGEYKHAPRLHTHSRDGHAVRASSHWRWSCMTTTSKVASGNGSSRSPSSSPSTGANLKSRPVLVRRLAPFDRGGIVVEPRVARAGAEVAVQRTGEHAGAAADLEHPLVRTHEREAAQQPEPGVPHLGVVALPHVAQPARRDQRVVAAKNQVDPISKTLTQACHETRRHSQGPYNPLMSHRLPERDKPWMMRTYAGHSTAAKSNELYRSNLEKGQTGLSIAFDLPTQTGYDPDDELARGEVGKVGVPVAHRGDMATLLEGIPLDRMNTSMTINATAAWLLALYIVTAEADGVAQEQLSGTTQNDIIKEFLARGTYAFPPEPSMRLIADMIAYTVENVPRWNPINICSYHLQEAGATPDQEVAYALRDRHRRARRRARARPVGCRGAGRGLRADLSFFVNAGVRFIEEHAKLRAMGILWEQLGRERYGVTDEKALRLRYGVQVNSLGLTETQPENNVQRIVLEALAVTLGRRRHAPAPSSCPPGTRRSGCRARGTSSGRCGSSRCWPMETDLLDYPDIFEGSDVMDGLVDRAARRRARGDRAVVAERGGAVEGRSDYMKAALVETATASASRRIEAGEHVRRRA